MNKHKMPKDFFWGQFGFKYMQTEGAWDEDGKGLSVYDVRPATENTTDWHTAIDEYHRYDEDLDLMKRNEYEYVSYSNFMVKFVPKETGILI